MPDPANPATGDLASWDWQCRSVLDSWKNGFQFRDEVRAGDAVVEKGLRPPQTGALHAVLAHWAVSDGPATIVMPTGTGKTETMLAVFVHQRLGRLLVVVPTAALRDQTVGKFESLGLLKDLGIVSDDARYPIVGTLEHKPRNADEVDQIFRRCNVVVSTMSIVGTCSPEVLTRMAECCSHLFVDEAHHIAAPTWDICRRTFSNRRVLQFTATPFRRDGKFIDGKVVFNYPLRKAQQEGYFQKIRFRPVEEYDIRAADAQIAATALSQLEEDIQNGFKHIVLARADMISRAETIIKIYEEIAGQYNPILIHSKFTSSERRAAMQQIRSGQSRVVVCVDMFGEGFDMPELKIAALHDMHRSLAVTLQFTGRFTRSRSDLGQATIIANIADQNVEDLLRQLYAENADWNSILQVISDGASGKHVKRSEFLERFIDVPPNVALQNIEPKMSAVVYRTKCSDWRPDRATGALGEKRVYAGPIVNPQDKAFIAITRDYEQVRWGSVKELSDVVWDLYLVHWDEQQKLLFINSTNNGSLHADLAKAIAGDDVQIIHGEQVFRSLHGVSRLILTNLGLNHTISRAVRFSMHVGSDIGEALTEAAVAHKTKSNLFGIGFEDGAKVTVGCSQKGRFWSYRIAYDMQDWIDWCHHVGAKLIDSSIQTKVLFENVMVPKPVTERPKFVPLAIEWPESVLERGEELIEIAIGDQIAPFYDLGWRSSLPALMDLYGSR